MVVGAPASSARGRARQAAVAAMLGASYAVRSDVRVVDIGDDPDLLALTRVAGPRLTAALTDRVAELLTTPMLELMR
jgi:hypothetical protein